MEEIQFFTLMFGSIFILLLYCLKWRDKTINSIILIALFVCSIPLFTNTLEWDNYANFALFLDCLGLYIANRNIMSIKGGK